MKKSMFVVKKEQPNGDCVLFCAETASIILLNAEAMELWNDNQFEKLPLYTKLVKMKFIIDDNEDQLAIQSQIRNSAKLPKDVDTMSFVIAPTLFCNARCSYCFEKDAGKKKMDQITENAMTEFIIKTVTEFNAKRIGIAWFGGEPLLEKKVIRRVSHRLMEVVGKENFNASITTNGSLIDDDTINLFKECQITSVQITLDGTEVIYNQIKSYLNSEKCNYKVVMENIERCCKHGMYVTIRLNISKQNFNDVKKVLAEVDKKFGQYKKRMNIYVFPIMGNKNDVELYDFNSAELKNNLEEINRILFELGYKTSYGAFGLKTRPVHCMAYRYHSYAIDPYGDIHKCEHYLGQPEKAVGNVFEGVDTNNHNFKTWIKDNISKQCETCSILPMCQGGCTPSEETNIGKCSLQLLILEQILDLVYKIYERRKKS